jgi:hypothetical protein
LVQDAQGLTTSLGRLCLDTATLGGLLLGFVAAAECSALNSLKYFLNGQITHLGLTSE